MKKIFLTLAIVFGGLVSAQDYYDTYPNDYHGYEYYDDSYDYPDDYYYNYPTDYYPDQYYQGYYNDYRQAVFSVNWNQFFVQYRLTPFQIDQILALNNRFATYAAWNAYYAWNPDRWYYDRFYALQNILGPRIFVVYQNNYFRGRSPIVFYKTRFTNFYARRYPVRPVYRNVNINVYKIDRRNFKEGFRTVGRNQGMINSTRNNGVRNDNPRSGSNGNNWGGIRGSENSGVRNQQNGGARPNENGGIRNSGGTRDANFGGIRSGSNSDNVRNQSSPNIRNQGGIRQNQNSERIENRSNERSIQRNSTPKSESGSRGSGMRFTSR